MHIREMENPRSFFTDFQQRRRFPMAAELKYCVICCIMTVFRERKAAQFGLLHPRDVPRATCGFRCAVPLPAVFSAVAPVIAASLMDRRAELGESMELPRKGHEPGATLSGTSSRKV